MTLQSLLSCVVFLYQKSMVHGVVRCRHDDKSGSSGLSFLVAHLQCVELDSTVDLYMTSKASLFLDEVFSMVGAVQDQAFVYIVCMCGTEGILAGSVGYHRVLPWFQHGDNV